MNRKPLTIRAFLICLLIAMQSAAAEEGTIITSDENLQLTIEINHLKSTNGQVIVLLFNNENGFPTESALAHRHGTTGINKDKAIFTFKGLKPGQYAVALYHDLNTDSELNRRWFGAPSEPYGFSNNAKGFMGPPDFDDCKFNLLKSKRITITMQEHG